MAVKRREKENKRAKKEKQALSPPGETLESRELITHPQIIRTDGPSPVTDLQLPSSSFPQNDVLNVQIHTN